MLQTSRRHRWELTHSAQDHLLTALWTLWWPHLLAICELCFGLSGGHICWRFVSCALDSLVATFVGNFNLWAVLWTLWWPHLLATCELCFGLSGSHICWRFVSCTKNLGTRDKISFKKLVLKVLSYLFCFFIYFFFFSNCNLHVQNGVSFVT